jgi:hypothetical protein
MKIEALFDGYTETFDTDRFTEATPFSTTSMVADFVLTYAAAETEGVWLDIHCYTVEGALASDDGTLQAQRMQGYRFKLVGQIETADMLSLVVDGEPYLVRAGERLVDMRKFEHVAQNCIGASSAALHARMLDLRTYLSNANDALAANPAALARSMGATQESIDYAIECESRQVQYVEEDEDWMDDADA